MGNKLFYGLAAAGIMLCSCQSDRYQINGFARQLEQGDTICIVLENEPERGKRCEACFYYRLAATARKAQELGIPFFATTLASSRWKNLDQINAAGKAAELPGVQFWPQNWRKDGLQERRNQLLKEYDFYNQTYCGCEFSMRIGHDGLCEQPAHA